MNNGQNVDFFAKKWSQKYPKPKTLQSWNKYVIVSEYINFVRCTEC